MKFEDLNLPDEKELAGVVKRNDENNGFVEGQFLSIGIRSTIITHRGYNFVISTNYMYPAFSEDYTEHGSYVLNVNHSKDFNHIAFLFSKVTNNPFIDLNINMEANEKNFNELIERGKRCIDIYIDKVIPLVSDVYSNFDDLTCRGSLYYNKFRKDCEEIASTCNMEL